MKINSQQLLVLLILACLSRPGTDISFSQSSAGSVTPKKRVFKNEDLEKYQEEHGSETAVVSKSGSVVTSSIEKASSQGQDSKGNPKQDLNAWRAKLKEIDDTIDSKKKMEGKLTDSLAKYSQKLAEADTDFYKLTAQQQVASVQENLSRTQAELKKAEEDKFKLLLEAKKSGIKEEVLLKSEPGGEAKE